MNIFELGNAFTSGAFARGRGDKKSANPFIGKRSKDARKNRIEWDYGFNAPFAIRAFAIAINHGILGDQNRDAVALADLIKKAKIAPVDQKQDLINKACKLAKTFYCVRWSLSQPVGVDKKEIDVEPNKMPLIARVRFTNVQKLNNDNEGVESRVCIVGDENGAIEKAFKFLRKANVPVNEPNVVGNDGMFTTDVGALISKFGSDFVDNSTRESRITAIG